MDKKEADERLAKLLERKAVTDEKWEVLKKSYLEQMGPLDEYVSPVTAYLDDYIKMFNEQRDNGIVAEINTRYNLNVDKEELVKALAYDRDQYRQGWNDAINSLLRSRLYWYDAKKGEYPPENTWIIVADRIFSEDEECTPDLHKVYYTSETCNLDKADGWYFLPEFKKD